MIIANSTHVDASLLFRSDKLYSGYLLKLLRTTYGCIDLIDVGYLIHNLIFVRLNVARPDLPALSQGAETWF